MNMKFGALFAAAGVFCVTVPVLAHHSFAVEYDATKPISGSGVISKVEWTNPHMRVYVDVTDEKGAVTTWNLELGSPNSVVRRGWKPADLKPGEKITFKGFGGRAVLTRAAADTLTLADGRSFAGASGSPDAPGGSAQGGATSPGK
jgi:hypothetical protein